MTSVMEALEGRWLCSHAVVPLKVKVPKYVTGSHTYADATFKAANWQTTDVAIGAGGTASGVQVKNGGDPGPYRLVTTTVASGQADSVLFGFQADAKATFNPAKQGAITTLDYAEANKLFSGFGQGQRTGPALEQSGQVYFLLDQFLDTPSTKWTKVKATGLTAVDFSTATDATAHPDFSQTAAPIEFGFFRANSAGYSGYTIAAGIDDWSVKVHTRKLV
jgi:hypothetical protein